MLKTEKEIRQEIEANRRAINNFRKSYKDKKIPKDVMQSEVLQASSIILALRWVLCENDRYD